MSRFNNTSGTPSNPGASGIPGQLPFLDPAAALPNPPPTQNVAPGPDTPPARPNLYFNTLPGKDVPAWSGPVVKETQETPAPVNPPAGIWGKADTGNTQSPSTVGQPPAPSMINNILRATGNFFHHVPILSLITDPMVSSSIQNAAHGYANYRAQYGKDVDALKAQGKNPPPEISFADYLKQRNLYSLAMTNPQVKRTVWLDQAHVYHSQGNMAAAKTALEFAGDNQQQIDLKVNTWDMHSFMRNNGQQFWKDINSKDWAGVQNLLKKAPPGVLQVLAPEVYKLQDAHTMAQMKHAEQTMKLGLENNKNLAAEEGKKQSLEYQKQKDKQDNETKITVAKIQSLGRAVKKASGNNPAAATKKNSIVNTAAKTISPLFNVLKPGDVSSGLNMAEAFAKDAQIPVSAMLLHAGVSFDNATQSLRVPSSIYGTSTIPLSLLPPDMQKKVLGWYAPQPTPTVNAPVAPTLNQGPVPGQGNVTPSPGVNNTPAPLNGKESGSNSVPTPTPPTVPEPLTKSGPMDEKEILSHVASGKKSGNSIIYTLKDLNLDADTKNRLIQGLKKKYPTANISIQNNIITVSAK